MQPQRCFFRMYLHMVATFRWLLDLGFEDGDGGKGIGISGLLGFDGSIGNGLLE